MTTNIVISLESDFRFRSLINENMKIVSILTCLILCQLNDSNAGMSPQNQDSFTIIGKIKGFKDGTKLYLKKTESGSAER